MARKKKRVPKVIKEMRREDLPEIAPEDIPSLPPVYPAEVPAIPINQEPSLPSETSLREKARTRDVAVELAKRQVEALKLYEPLPLLEQFHVSNAKMRILRGSNRSGKTLGACAEVARAVCGLDPHDKYPRENGRWFIVARDGKEIGQVLHRKLFRADAFKIIRDRKYPHRWRAWKPWLEDDLERFKIGRGKNDRRPREVFPAPPLIPPRMIKSVAWEMKSANIPNIVTLHNGWEISFFSSNAKPPHGADIDGALFDEEIIDPDWLGEITARLVDRRGKFIWSATPQAGTDQLYQLHESAIEESIKPEPLIEEYVTYLDDNNFLTKQAKDEFAATLQTDEERRVRIGGEFALTSYRVYAEFNVNVHGVPAFPIPDDWCRYMVIDPGWQVCAVLFAAVPPPLQEDAVYLYDELYLKNCSAEMFGLEVGKKAQGQRFHAFLMDLHGGVQHEVGSGLTKELQYSQALKANGVKSTMTGHGFLWGSDDIRAGVLAAHSWLHIRENGKPKLRILKDRLKNFERESKFYHHKRRPDGTVTDEVIQKYNHLMDCLRYLAMYQPKWYAPPKKVARDSWAVAMLKQKRERAKARDGEQYIHLGPGKGPARQMV